MNLIYLSNIIADNQHSPEIFDEYTRRQYLAKAPARNPFGDDEEPKKFAGFDVFTKLRVLFQLSQWTFINAERMRERMSEVKDAEQTQWVRTVNELVDHALIQSSRCSVSKKLATTNRIDFIMYSMTTAFIAAPTLRPLLPHPPNPKQIRRRVRPLLEPASEGKLQKRNCRQMMLTEKVQLPKLRKTLSMVTASVGGNGNALLSPLPSIKSFLIRCVRVGTLTRKHF